MAMTTEGINPARSGDGRRAARPGLVGPDRASVVLFTLAAFLLVLALMAWHLRTGPKIQARSVATVRRVYETRVVETVVGGGGRSSVTQSSSSAAGSYSSAAPPTTRAS
jgi:hypothetical protein